MTKKSLPSPELLRKLLRYEPETGKLFWRERPKEMFPIERNWKMWNTFYVGKEAFITVDPYGYLRGKIFGRHYRAHRVIWAIVAGAWQTDEIDHIDHEKTNNRWSNLREVSHLENGRNQSMAINNTSGVTGVGWHKRGNKWIAKIHYNDQSIYLGLFDNLADAAAARAEAEIKYGYHENHGK